MQTRIWGRAKRLVLAVLLVSAALTGTAAAQDREEPTPPVDSDVLWEGGFDVDPARADDGWEDPAQTYNLDELDPASFATNGLSAERVGELFDQRDISFESSSFESSSFESGVLAAGIEPLILVPSLTGEPARSAVLAEQRLARTLQAEMAMVERRAAAALEIRTLRSEVRAVNTQILAIEQRTRELQELIAIREEAISQFAVEAFIGGDKSFEETLIDPNAGLNENRITANQVREEHLREIDAANKDIETLQAQRRVATAERRDLKAQIAKQQEIRQQLLTQIRQIEDQIELAITVVNVSYHERMTLLLPGTDIPIVAINAYVIAERVLAEERPECGVAWWMLAGIGRIESYHGGFGGSTLDWNGTTTKGIFGIALDGRILEGEEFLTDGATAPKATGQTETQAVSVPAADEPADDAAPADDTAPADDAVPADADTSDQTAAPPAPAPVIKRLALIRDSDDGALDQDTVYDRAVGPMQFIPQTWRRWGSDTNRDGINDPQNMYDATVAAARYLCAAAGSVAGTAGQEQALFAYNHDTDYTTAVITAARLYRSMINVEPPKADGDRRLVLGIAAAAVEAEQETLKEQLLALGIVLPNW